MTVKQLIERLSKCNPEAEVIGYSDLGECDFVIDNLEEVIINDNEKDFDEKLRYCCDCSVVEEDFIGKPIVYLSE